MRDRIRAFGLRGLAALAGMVLLAGAAAAQPARVVQDLNLRSGPGTQFSSLGVLPRGAVVEVYSCSGSWCQVEWRGRVGFASRRFLAEAAPTRPPRPPIPAPSPVPPPFPFPFPFPFPDAERPPIPAPSVCRAERAEFLIGLRATQSLLEDALDRSGARTLRVERPGEFYTQEFRRDRLSVELDARGRVVDVACR